jgi:Ca-activated chloride channel family protein
LTAVAAPPRPPRGQDPEALFEEARRHRRRRRLKLAVPAAVFLAAGTVALALLGRGTTGPSTTPVLNDGVLTSVPKRTVMLLVDVSAPTPAADGERHEARVAAMQTFIDRLPSQFAVGVVSFNRTARVVQTPTVDRELLRRALLALGSQAPDTTPGNGLGTAIDLTVTTLARKRLRRAPGHSLPAVVVLESNSAPIRGVPMPLEAAARAKQTGIRVHAVALAGVARYDYGIEGIFPSRIRIPPVPAIAQVSRVTGGETFTAEATADLRVIHENLAAAISR